MRGHATRTPAVTPPSGGHMTAPAVDPGAFDALAATLDSTPMTLTPSTTPLPPVDLDAGTIADLQRNFAAAAAAHPDLDITWEALQEAVTLFVNESARATTDEGRAAACRKLAELLATVPRTDGTDGASPDQAETTTDGHGALPTGGAFQTGTDQGQSRSGATP